VYLEQHAGGALLTMNASGYVDHGLLDEVGGGALDDGVERESLGLARLAASAESRSGMALRLPKMVSTYPRDLAASTQWRRNSSIRGTVGGMP